MTLPDAARMALETHDRLREVYEREPDSDVEPEAWVEWHHAEYRPAYDAWHAAMDDLIAAGYEQGSRHPHNFRPFCEEVLAQ